MARTKNEKGQIVGRLKTAFSKATSFVLADYHGLTVNQMQELKNLLKSVSGEFTVAKNTLILLASKDTGKKIPPEVLVGPTAVAFTYSEPIEAIKKLADFIKKFELPKIRVGFLEGRLISKDEITLLAGLPGKTELYAKVVGSLNSPIYGLVGVLNANLSNLVYVLNQIANTKGGANQ